jgi:small nuclear ribonucleoprotein (snRNP)-like protein
MEAISPMYSSFIGKRVRIKNCDNAEFIGRPVALDAFLNVSLESVYFHEAGSEKPQFFAFMFVKGSYIDHIAIEEATG